MTFPNDPAQDWFTQNAPRSDYKRPSSSSSISVNDQAEASFDWFAANAPTAGTGPAANRRLPPQNQPNGSYDWFAANAPGVDTRPASKPGLPPQNPPDGSYDWFAANAPVVDTRPASKPGLRPQSPPDSSYDWFAANAPTVGRGPASKPGLRPQSPSDGSYDWFAANAPVVDTRPASKPGLRPQSPPDSSYDWFAANAPTVGKGPLSKSVVPAKSQPNTGSDWFAENAPPLRRAPSPPANFATRPATQLENSRNSDPASLSPLPHTGSSPNSVVWLKNQPQPAQAANPSPTGQSTTTADRPSFTSEAQKKAQQLGHFLGVGTKTLVGLAGNDPALVTEAITTAAADTGGRGIDASELVMRPLRELAGVPQPGESIMLPDFMDEHGNETRQPLLWRAGMMLDTLMGGDPAAAREKAAKGNTGAAVADLLATPGMTVGPARVVEALPRKSFIPDYPAWRAANFTRNQAGKFQGRSGGTYSEPELQAMHDALSQQLAQTPLTSLFGGVQKYGADYPTWRSQNFLQRADGLWGRPPYSDPFTDTQLRAMYDAQASVQTSVIKGLAQSLHDIARRTTSSDPQDLFINFADSDSAAGPGAENATAPGTRVKLVPYRGPGGGHHVGSQEAFLGAENYDPFKALAIPNEELRRLGINHQVITGAQQRLYIEFAKKGGKLTWDDMERIETQALVDAKMSPDLAKDVVQRAFKHLKNSGVAGPTKTPWGGRYIVKP